jgi:hypothetical protein
MSELTEESLRAGMEAIANMKPEPYQVITTRGQKDAARKWRDERCEYLTRRGLTLTAAFRKADWEAFNRFAGPTFVPGRIDAD